MQDEERVGLLDGEDDYEETDGVDGRAALRPVEDIPDLHWPESVQFGEKLLRKIWDFMSPPLIGAIIALVVGVRLLTPYVPSLYTV